MFSNKFGLIVMVLQKKTMVKFAKVSVWSKKDFPSRFQRVFWNLDVFDQRANSGPLSLKLCVTSFIFKIVHNVVLYNKIRQK